MTPGLIKLDPRHIEAAAKAAHEKALKFWPGQTRWEELSADDKNKHCQIMHAALTVFLRAWL